MLRVTVELWPGGRTNGRRTLATADIWRARSGARADYEFELGDDLLPDQVWRGCLQDYPRWSATVWDLVARSIAVALTGTEELPPRPTTPLVPVHGRDSGSPYVLIDEIPEPTRTFFIANLRSSSVPGLNSAYVWDWEDFLAGQR
ncbi:hypothetical protein AWV79_24265 [Cupriavidus sp. UYMMa02A]|nr:hypothetical protein AWV79_24265 [Cupriavidus sp. UYMMa02A]